MEHFLINDEIKFDVVRVVSEDYSGVFSTKELLERLEPFPHLSLILINDKAEIPICKVEDFQKFLFKRRQAEKQKLKNQVKTTTKEIRLTPVINDNDLQIKINKIIEFLNKGDKVKISMFFKGRLINNKDAGIIIIGKIQEAINDIGVFESKPVFEGKKMLVTIKKK